MILHTWAPRLHYDSKQAQDLKHKADAEVDPQKRAALYQEVLQLLIDEGPHIMLVQGKAPVVTRAKRPELDLLPDWRCAPVRRQQG